MRKEGLQLEGNLNDCCSSESKMQNPGLHCHWQMPMANTSSMRLQSYIGFVVINIFLVLLDKMSLVFNKTKICGPVSSSSLHANVLVNLCYLSIAVLQKQLVNRATRKSGEESIDIPETICKKCILVEVCGKVLPLLRAGVVFSRADNHMFRPF